MIRDLAELFSEAIGDEDIIELNSISREWIKIEHEIGLNDIYIDFYYIEIEITK